jgi:DNA topoisomerase II
MIIDGTLVVAKKKKRDLVAELKKLKFKPFPKVADARKAGEFESVVEEDAGEEPSSDAETEIGANDYDYLLGVSHSSHYLFTA